MGKNDRDMTHGNLKRTIILFALPLVVSNILQSLYSAVDMYFAGQFLGTNALSAISVSGPIVTLMLGAVMGMSLGVTVTVGTYVGLHDDTRLKRGVSTAVAVYAIAAVVITVAGVAATPLLLRLVNTPAEAFADAVVYMRITFGGMVFTLGYNLICAIQRGRGDSQSSMYFVMAATVVNAVLDYVFLKYCDMGVMGTAVATITAQAISFLLGVFYLTRTGRELAAALIPRAIDREALRLLFRTGLPGMMHQFSMHFSGFILSGLVNSYGVVASAAYGIGLKINSFANLPSTAVSDAQSCVASQNIGAGNLNRAELSIRHGSMICVYINFVMTAVLYCFAPQLAGILDKNAEVIAAATLFLRVCCFTNLGECIVHPLVGFFRGTGNSGIVLANSLFTQYALKIPASYICAKVFEMHAEAVAVGMLFATYGTAIIYWIYYRSRRWEKHIPAIR